MRRSILTRASGRSRRRPGPRKGWPTHKARFRQKQVRVQRIRARTAKYAGGANMIAVYRRAGSRIRTGRRSCRGKRVSVRRPGGRCEAFRRRGAPPVRFCRARKQQAGEEFVITFFIKPAAFYIEEPDAGNEARQRERVDQ